MSKKGKSGTSNDLQKQLTLRLWPGIAIVIIQSLIFFVIPRIIPEAFGAGMAGGFLGGILVIVWWVFLSRAARIERWSAVLLMILGMAVTSFIIDESMAASQVGLTFLIYGIPFLSIAFVFWAVLTKNLTDKIRRVSMLATILLACFAWTLVRTDGMTGDIGHEFKWRWAQNPEDQLTAQADEEQMSFPADTEGIGPGAEWPGFRGPERDGIIHGIRIDTDWSASQPLELWRKPIGPGLSSFALQGDLIFTQEQRGEEEIVSCYSIVTGDPVWKHRDNARFFGADANPGPRATPIIHEGRVYAIGATGILNALDAFDGSVVWSRNAAEDIAEPLPVWGFSGSPVITEGVVIVAVAGTLVAYDLDTGEQKWVGPDGGDSYSSPQLVTIDGVSQVVLLSETGASSVSPADGELYWEHPWPIDTRIVQVALTDNEDVLISDIKGMRRITVDQALPQWIIQERWTSFQMKPNFNDFVVHKGHAYGYHVQNLSCIDLENGKRKWKGGRYGGQIILLAKQDLLILLSEKGELVLVKAAPDKFRELATFQAIDGKTWNHPVLVGDRLLVRNNREMAMFQLSILDD